MVLRKRVIEKDVLTLARERIAHIYDRFDHVAVSFSGGKDSTVCLQLTLDEARRRGKLPLDVVHFDEEAIHPPTVDYVRRCAENPEVSLRWYCLPVQHRNACSQRSIYWYPWAEEDRERWVRPLPPEGITELEGFNRHPVPACNPFLYSRAQGQVGVIVGIRASESLRRYRSVARRVYDNYIAIDPHCEHVSLCKPIYDWSTDDVWSAPAKFGWDYNSTYDVLTAAGITRHDQRVCPPYGEEPLRGLWMYAVCFPEMWEAMIHRVPGAATAARYSRSPLYGQGALLEKPPEVSWQDFILRALERWPEEARPQVKARIREEIARHVVKTKGAPIPDEESHPESGLSWQYLYMVATRGNFKKRKQAADHVQKKERSEVGRF